MKWLFSEIINSYLLRFSFDTDVGQGSDLVDCYTSTQEHSGYYPLILLFEFRYKRNIGEDRVIVTLYLITVL
jgi:hypothetical protein